MGVKRESHGGRSTLGVAWPVSAPAPSHEQKADGYHAATSVDESHGLLPLLHGFKEELLLYSTWQCYCQIAESTNLSPCHQIVTRIAYVCVWILIRNKVVFKCKNGNVSGLHLQPSHSLLCILNLSNTRVSVLPEIEEFLVMLYSFAFPAFLRFFRYLLPSFKLT